MLEAVPNFLDILSFIRFSSSGETVGLGLGSGAGFLKEDEEIAFDC